MSSLIVLLPAATASITAEYDYVLTHDGHSVAAHGRCSANLLPRDGEVVAVLDVAALSWHSVRLPKGALSARGARNTPRLRTALDALLEDNLLDDAAKLHLGLAPQPQPEGHWLVAACAKEPLLAHLQALEVAGRAVARVVPELEPGAPQWLALEVRDRACLAWVSPEAVCALPLSAGGVRQVVAASGDSETPLWAEPACAALAERMCQRQAQLQQRELRWLQAAQSAWDLAQFDLVSSTQARQLKRLSQTWHALAHAPQWRAARWGFAALVLVHVVGLNAWAWHERQALRDLRLKIQSTLTQTFPHVRAVVDAPVQMERELDVLRRASGGTQASDMEALLAALANAAPGGKSVAALDFGNGQLRLKGLQLSGDELRALQERLREPGLTATPEGDTLVLEVKR